MIDGIPDKTTFLELVQRIESMEIKLSSPQFHKPEGTCLETLAMLAVSSHELTLVMEELMDKWIWLAINSLASNSIMIHEINDLREQLGLPIITNEELSKKMYETAPKAEKMIAEIMRKFQ
jgi:hypothetical protein